MAGGDGGGAGRDDDGCEGRWDGVGRGTVKEDEGGIQASDRAMPEADVWSAAVEGGGGGGDGEDDMAERQRRKKSGGRMDGGERDVWGEVEVVEVKE